MSRSGRTYIYFTLLLMAVMMLSTPAFSSNIYVKEGKAVYYSDKVFLDSGEMLKKPVIVQYFGENSVSIIIADEAVVEENNIRIPVGEQFILDHNGKVSQRLRFQDTVIDNTLGKEIPGTYIEGSKAMVMFEGLFTTLLIEEQEMGKRKVSLAQKREFDEESGELHLFDGFSLLLDKNNNLEEQVSFRELALGGTLKCQIDAGSSFPQVQPQVVMTSPGFPNPYYSTVPPYSSEPREIKLDEVKYDVPKLKRVGIIPFKEEGAISGYAEYIPEIVKQYFANEDVEIVLLELTDEEKQGIYLFDRAVKLGEVHDIDGIIQGKVRKFEAQGSEHEQRFLKDVKMTCEIEASLVDTIGGRYLWKNNVRMRDFKPGADYARSEKSILRSLLTRTMSKLCEDIKTKQAFEGVDRS
jgi:hypothetical protein